MTPSASDATLPPKPHWFEPRIALLYFAVFLPNGVMTPFLPIWLENLQFSAGSIAVVLSAQLFMRVVATPALSSLADRLPDRAPMLIGTALATFAITCLYLLPPSFALVLAVTLAHSIFQPLQQTLTDSLAVSGVRRYRSDYSRMRIWGSISYLAGNIVAGIVLARSGAGIVPWLLILGYGLMVAVSIATPRLGRPRRPTVANPAEGVMLLKNRAFLFLVLAVAAIQGSHAFLYGFASIFWRSQGLSDSIIGALWALGTLAEVVLFVAFPRFLGHFSAQRIIVIAGVAAVLRWLAFSFSEPLGLGPVGYTLLMALHALSTGLIIIGMQKAIAEIVPESQTSGAQGITFMANQASVGLFTLLAGFLYARVGAFGFLSMAMLAAIGLGIAFAARQPQSAGGGGETREPS
ncbi:MAG: MFS transporter [Methylobacterium mesophilicum]|nr:MFS transporter [Methylobacterium mesophilicum]